MQSSKRDERSGREGERRNSVTDKKRQHDANALSARMRACYDNHDDDHDDDDNSKRCREKKKRKHKSKQTTQSFKWYVRVLNWSTGLFLSLSRIRSRSPCICFFFFFFQVTHKTLSADFLFSSFIFRIIHSFWNSPYFKMVDVHRATITRQPKPTEEKKKREDISFQFK